MNPFVTRLALSGTPPGVIEALRYVLSPSNIVELQLALVHDYMSTLPWMRIEDGEHHLYYKLGPWDVKAHIYIYQEPLLMFVISMDEPPIYRTVQTTQPEWYASFTRLVERVTSEYIAQ